MFSRIKRFIAIALISGLVLVGCGQKGPLYHPEPAEDQTKG